MQTTPRKPWTEVRKRIVAAQQDFTCALCRQRLGMVWAADHIVPLHLGGTNQLPNCQILCPNCHAEKTQREQFDAADRMRERKTRRSRYWHAHSMICMEKSKDTALEAVVDKWRVAAQSTG